MVTCDYSFHDGIILYYSYTTLDVFSCNRIFAIAWGNILHDLDTVAFVVILNVLENETLNEKILLGLEMLLW